MEARPKRAVAIDDLRDVAREIVRFVERRGRRSVAVDAMPGGECDEATGDRDLKRMVH